MNKIKYDLFTILMVVITLTVLGVGALIFAHFNGQIGDELKDTANEMVNDGSLNQTNADIATDFSANDIEKYSDNYVFWFFIVIFISLILTALYLDFEPSVMIIIFIVGLIGVLGAWLGSNIYGGFNEDTDLSTTSGTMNKTKLLMSTPYFPVFIFVGLVVMLIIMYNKKRAGEYQ
jgi:hypothetical protein